MRVSAAPGLKCPMEGAPRKYIGADPVEVRESAYYKRLVADGSLIVAPAPARKKEVKTDGQ